MFGCRMFDVGMPTNACTGTQNQLWSNKVVWSTFLKCFVVEFGTNWGRFLYTRDKFVFYCTIKKSTVLVRL